jgi:two-component system, LytTR family, response regulator
MRTLIVDDEQPARDRMRLLLGALEDVQIAGEAEDGERAIELIRELRPELVLLDIQMAGFTGIEVAAALPAPRPKIIFCTAYDQYAVDAFELSAVDYLVKPINRGRLARAIERVRAMTASELDANVDGAIHRPRMAPARFLGRRGDSVLVIPQAEVLYFGSEGGLTKLYTAQHHYVMDPTLNDFERRLEPAVFYRVSRTAIVNLEYVIAVELSVAGYGDVVLKNGVRLEVSRRRLKDLMARLEGGV